VDAARPLVRPQTPVRTRRNCARTCGRGFRRRAKPRLRSACASCGVVPHGRERLGILEWLERFTAAISGHSRRSRGGRLPMRMECMSEQTSSVWKQQVEAGAAQAGTRGRAVAHAVQTLADELRTDAGTAVISDLTGRGADAIDRVGVYLEESDFDTLVADAEDYSRDHPLVVAVAGVALGIAVSRVVKATAARRSATQSPTPRAERDAPSKQAKARRPRARKPADAR
jgi:hypothetical protein